MILTINTKEKDKKGYIKSSYLEALLLKYYGQI